MNNEMKYVLTLYHHCQCNSNSVFFFLCIFFSSCLTTWSVFFTTYLIISFLSFLNISTIFNVCAQYNKISCSKQVLEGFIHPKYLARSRPAGFELDIFSHGDRRTILNWLYYDKAAVTVAGKKCSFSKSAIKRVFIILSLKK